jgi:hypothetical protein
MHNLTESQRAQLAECERLDTAARNASSQAERAHYLANSAEIDARNRAFFAAWSAK